MLIRLFLFLISGGGCVLENSFLDLRLHICALIRVANSGGNANNGANDSEFYLNLNNDSANSNSNIRRQLFIKYIDTDIQTIVANNCALLNHKNPLEEVLT
jgi:hypothetical protein